jgi:hypothetical protein
MREIVTFQFEGQQLVGTLHRPDQPIDRRFSKRLVLLWLNSGYLPRSPAADVISHVSDQLAQEQGLCSLRVDLPGLGDSQGTLTDDTQTYFSRVTRGLNVDAANAIAKETCARLGFDGVIMGGICGAAITSMFAADSQDLAPIEGLVLLDPSFKLVQPFQALSKSGSQATADVRRLSLKDMVATARVRVLERPWGQRLRRGWRFVKPAIAPAKKLVKAFRRDAYLPPDANRPLFDAFRRITRRGLPTLVLMPGDERANAERFDYVGLVTRQGADSITRHYIAGTNHAFSEGSGESRVRNCLVDWASGRFG